MHQFFCRHRFVSSLWALITCKTIRWELGGNGVFRFLYTSILLLSGLIVETFLLQTFVCNLLPSWALFVVLKSLSGVTLLLTFPVLSPCRLISTSTCMFYLFPYVAANGCYHIALWSSRCSGWWTNDGAQLKTEGYITYIIQAYSKYSLC